MVLSVKMETKQETGQRKNDMPIIGSEKAGDFKGVMRSKWNQLLEATGLTMISFAFPKPRNNVRKLKI